MDGSGVEPPRLMLTISGLISRQYANASAMPCELPLPELLNPLIHTHLASGATPTIPTPLFLAHIIPTQ